MNVLIIEDEREAAAVLRARFERIGLSTESRDSFASAIEALIESDPKPVVITVDINLTDSRGEETIQRVNQIRDLAPDAVILIISGVLKPNDAARLEALGADAAFEKMEITTEKTFWQRFRDTLSGVSKQAGLHRNLTVVRDLTSKATDVYNESGASLRHTPPDASKPPE